MARRTLTATSAVLAIAALAAMPGTATAADPWPMDGASPYNFRLGSSFHSPFGGQADELKQQWRTAFKGGATGTPVIDDDGYVYVGTWGANVMAIARANGYVKWSHFVPGAVPGSLLIQGDTLYAVVSRVGSPRLVALDKDTGHQKWSTTVDTQQYSDAWASPAYSAEHNLVYVATCACQAEKDKRSGVRVRGSVVAVDATTGALRWKTYVVPANMNGGAVAGTPLVIDPYDRLYVGTDHAYTGQAHENTDAIVALDTATGAIVGSLQVKAGDVAEASSGDLTKRQGFTSALNIIGPNADGKYPVVGGAGTGKVYAVEPLTLQRLWEADVALPSPDGGVVGSAAWDGKRLHGTAARPGLMWGLTVEGQRVYSWPGTDVDHYGAASASRYDSIYTADSAGFLDTYDAVTGRPFGRFPLGGASVGGVSFAHRTAFVSVGTGSPTETGAVVAFK